MSISKIKGLRNERKNKVESLKKKIESLQNNDMYSDQYKLEQKNKIESELNDVKGKYDAEIMNMIDEKEGELLKGYHQAEYSGLSEEQTMTELLKEMRNQQQAQHLIKNYEGADGSTLRNELLGKAQKMIEENSPHAMAYINAAKSLGVVGVDQLEQEYKNNNLNDLQKAYKSDLDALREQREEFKLESEGDPFERALARYNT